MHFKGLIPPVITPHRDDFSVDEQGFAAVLEFMIGKGVEAIIIGGTTGEYYAQTPEERTRLFRLGQEVIKGRVPWIAGVNDARTEEAASFAGAAREAGADGVLIAAPYYSLPAELELAEHCLEVDRAGGLPIMLYNYPGRTGVTMGETFLDAVSGQANFQCIKEASGDIDRLHLLALRYPNLQLSCGADDQALEFFAWGATSWVTPLGNFFPEEADALYRACALEGDYDKGRRIMSALFPLTSLLERGGKFMQCVKFACELYGLPGGPPRKPMRPMDEALREDLRGVLQTAKAEIAAILADSGGRQEVA